MASDGGIFAFGDAPFYGSLGGHYARLSRSPPWRLPTSGGGYWLVDANGQVFTFGDAHFEGQPAYAPGGYRITGMAPPHNANGYWLASANGNVADEGNAAPYGSLIGHTLNAPIVGMAATRDGDGYWLQGGDGGIFCFGDAAFLGSMGGKHLNAPMVGHRRRLTHPRAEPQAGSGIDWAKWKTSSGSWRPLIWRSRGRLAP